MKNSTRNIVTVVGGVAIAGLAFGGIAWGQSVLQRDPVPTPTATIQTANPIETTVTLELSPETTAVEGTAVTAAAAVSPVVAGSVEFFDGVVSLGRANIVGGSAVLSATLSVGAHTITASFTPANEVAYAKAESTAATFTVTEAPDPVVEAPVYEEPSGPDLCPSGTQANQSDGYNDLTCFPDSCYVGPVSNETHPECITAMPPDYYR